MTTLLQQAFEQAAKLSEAEQELLASRLLAEMAAEDEFDQAISRTAQKLSQLSEQALSEYHSGQTEELDPDQL